MNASSCTVLLFSNDRGALRRLTAALTTAGCRLQQTSHKEQAAALLAADPPDLLILDAGPSLRPALGLLQVADSDHQGRRPYTLVIVDKPNREDLFAAVEAGANDFLKKPVANGELLARVQAGRCFRRYERRLLDMGGSHTVTGLAGFSAFEHRLRRELSRPGRKAGTPSLVAVDLDFFHAIPRLHGDAIGTAVLQATGKALQEAAEGAASVYVLGADRFMVLLPGVTEEAAASWAKHAQKTLAELEFPVKGQILRIAASCGVAGDGTEEDPERLIGSVFEALHAAKSSGRDCVVQYGELTAESASDAAVAPLKLLQNSVARDIFTPCTLELQADDCLVEAAALFRRTRLPAFPVVDVKGDVAGVLTEDAVRAARDSAATATVAEAMSADVVTFDERTEFLTLLEYFAQHPEAIAIVVRDGRPTGLLTSDSLVAPVDSTAGCPASEGAATVCNRPDESTPLRQGSAAASL
jgi:two-component system, cell cycle response regulator